MDNRFEYPLPILSVSADEPINIETKDRYEGRFKIKNTGGSVLAGRILSRSRSITFEPSAWEGNEVEILYRFTPEAADGWKPGDEVDTCCVICSNGGEKKLPIHIRLTKMAIVTSEGITIANLKDFFAYAAEYPAQARRLFVDSEFYMLLLATGYEYMEAYEILHKDLNRERALDNFFILSGMKRKTGLSLPKKKIEFSKPLYDTNMVYGSFLVQKSDSGYLEAPVSLRYQVSWLSISAERLITADFNEADTAVVKFSIDPLRIAGRYAREVVMIGGEEANQVELVYRRMPAIIMRLDREAYRYEDQGNIEIVNNTGGDLTLEVFCQDNYIRFTGRRFSVGERSVIPFEIKLSTLMSAQLLFRKTPFMRSVIEVRAVWRDTVIRKKMPVTVGKW